MPTRTRVPASTWLTGALLLAAVALPLALFEEAGAEAGEEGRWDLRRIFDRIPHDPEFAHLTTEDWEELVAASESGECWGTLERYSELEAKLERVLEHHRRLRSDPEYVERFILEKLIRKHPAYCEIQNRLFRFAPYWIFVEHRGEPGTPSGEAEERSAERIGKMLQALYRQFHEAFGERLNLPDVSELERDWMRMLTVFVFSGQPSFKEYQQLVWHPLPPGASAYYLSRDGYVNVCEPGDRAALPGRPTVAQQQILHEATHQIVHLYTEVLVEREERGEGKWAGWRFSPECYWFQEGMAELFAGAVRSERGEWTLLAPNRYRIDELRQTRARKFSEWPLEELLGITTVRELQECAAQHGLRHQGRLGSLFFAQAWSWVHFLYNFEDGKYRDRFFEYAKKEFHGVTGPEVFEKVWFGDGPVDWSGVEKEWLAHVEELLEGE